MSEQAIKVAEEWLAASTRTVADKDLGGHLNLISPEVSLTGIPGFEAIDYQAWAAQCEHEFENSLISSVAYHGLKIVAETDNRVMFRTWETVQASDGAVNAQGIEVLLQREADNQWRVVQERVLPEEESAHEGLVP